MLNQLKLPYLIETSIILAFGYIMYRLLFAADKRYVRNRIYLMSLLGLSFVLPLISLPVYAQRMIALPLEVKDGLISSANPSIVETSNLDWGGVIFILYFGVVAFMMLRLLFHIVYVSYIITYSKRSIVNGIQYVITDKLTTPASIFNFLLTDASDLPQAIIDHERIHMRHGHTYDILLLEVAKVFLWFNPFVYWFTRELKNNHEYIADQLAANSLGDGLDYASLLLQYAKTTQSPVILNAFSFITKKRIIMLHKKTSQNSWKSIFILPILLVIVSLFSCDSYLVSDNTNKLDNANLPNIRLDTIVTFDPATGEETMTVERVYVDQIVQRIDTIVTFDYDTFSEEVDIVKTEGPRTEILLETFTAKEYNNVTGDMEANTYHRYPQDLVRVIDTIVTFDQDTYEEDVTVIEGTRARQELISSKVISQKK